MSATPCRSPHNIKATTQHLPYLPPPLEVGRRTGGLNAFFDRQKQSFETVSGGSVLKSPARLWRLWRDGTILLVMCEGMDAVFDPSRHLIQGRDLTKSRLIQRKGTLAVPAFTLRSLWREGFDNLTSPGRVAARLAGGIIMEHTTVRSHWRFFWYASARKRIPALSFYRGHHRLPHVPPGASSTFWLRPNRSSARFSPWFLSGGFPMSPSLAGSPFPGIWRADREASPSEELDAGGLTPTNWLCLGAPDRIPATAGMRTRQGCAAQPLAKDLWWRRQTGCPDYALFLALRERWRQGAERTGPTRSACAPSVGWPHSGHGWRTVRLPRLPQLCVVAPVDHYRKAYANGRDLHKSAPCVSLTARRCGKLFSSRGRRLASRLWQEFHPTPSPTRGVLGQSLYGWDFITGRPASPEWRRRHLASCTTCGAIGLRRAFHTYWCIPDGASDARGSHWS